MNKIFINYAVECAHCGEDLDVEVEPANLVIKINPCTKCANKMADEYKDNLREKILIVVDND